MEQCHYLPPPVNDLLENPTARRQHCRLPPVKQSEDQRRQCRPHPLRPMQRPTAAASGPPHLHRSSPHHPTAPAAAPHHYQPKRHLAARRRSFRHCWAQRNSPTHHQRPRRHRSEPPRSNDAPGPSSTTPRRLPTCRHRASTSLGPQFSITQRIAPRRSTRRLGRGCRRSTEWPSRWATRPHTP